MSTGIFFSYVIVLWRGVVETGSNTVSKQTSKYQHTQQSDTQTHSDIFSFQSLIYSYLIMLKLHSSNMCLMCA